MAGEAGLWGLHDRLRVHFGQLRDDRQRAAPGAPVFALEHGLDDDELIDLQQRVRSGLRLNIAEHEAWLPFVVYASEIGYGYSGSAYWPTFIEQTPEWARHGDKYRLRSWFVRFSKDFGGASISGRWARQFPIIAWPITHAVLPTDLQSKLARLLFDSQAVFSAETLGRPHDLGRILGQQSEQTSSARFQHFAENSEILGYVASALLTGDEEDSPYLSRATLHRIVVSLSRDAQTRGWLGAAKSAARRNRTRATPPASGSSRSVEPRRFRKPRLTLQRSLSGWGAFIDFPQIQTALTAGNGAFDEFQRRRHVVDGIGRILPPGELLRSSRPHKLQTWPSGDAALVHAENGSDELNDLLAKAIRLPTDDLRIFEVHNGGAATQRRSRQVRPGASYVVVTGSVEFTAVTWIERVHLDTEGMQALLVRVPNSLHADDVCVLAEIGLLPRDQLQISPAGVVAMDWDGFHEVTWLPHDTHVLRIESPQLVQRLAVAIDGVEHDVEWPSAEQEIFLDVGPLEVGAHEVLFWTGDSSLGVEPSISVVVHILSNRSARPGGEPGEAIRLLTSTSTPTLGGIWQGEDRLDIYGPDGVRVDVTASLYDRHSNHLADARGRTKLPVRDAHLIDLLNRAEIRDLEPRLQEAESLQISITAPTIASTGVTVERGFEALRWITGGQPAAPTVVLSDNTDLHGRAHLYDYEEPAKAIAIDVGTPISLPRLGGLVSAEAGQDTARLIVSPPPDIVRELRDVVPRVTPSRDASYIQDLLDVAGMWGQAETTGNSMSDYQRRRVVRVMTSALARSVHRDRWSKLDLDLTTGVRTFDQSESEYAFRRSTAATPSLTPSKQDLYALVAATVEQRVALFASLIRSITPGLPVEMTRYRLARLTLMAASNLPSLVAETTPEERQRFVQLLMTTTSLMALARFIVLTLEDADDDGVGYFGDWVWS